MRLRMIRGDWGLPNVTQQDMGDRLRYYALQSPLTFSAHAASSLEPESCHALLFQPQPPECCSGVNSAFPSARRAWRSPAAHRHSEQFINKVYVHSCLPSRYLSCLLTRPTRLWITKATLQRKKCYIFPTDLYFLKSPWIRMTERIVIIPFFHSSLSTVTQVTVVKGEKEPSGLAQGTQFESFKAALLFFKRLLGLEFM